MSRIGSVDTCRLLASFAVVLIHTTPLLGNTAAKEASFGAASWINLLARFAVPLFFILAGYFWAFRCERQGEFLTISISTIKRLLLILAVWSLVYLFPTSMDEIRGLSPLGVLKQAYWNLLSLDLPRTLLTGTRFHLWFISSLAMCVAISAIALAQGWTRLLVGAAAFLYLITLLGGAYAVTPLGLELGFNPRFGPVAGLIFFVMGYVLHRMRGHGFSAHLGVWLLAAGTALSLAETWLLHVYFQNTVFNEFLLGTLLTGAGAALLALSGHPALSSERLGRLGMVSLGIYAVHVLVIDLLAPLHAAWTGLVAWELAYPVLVFVLAVCIAFVLSRIPFVRAVVA